MESRTSTPVLLHALWHQYQANTRFNIWTSMQQEPTICGKVACPSHVLFSIMSLWENPRNTGMPSFNNTLNYGLMDRNFNSTAANQRETSYVPVLPNITFRVAKVQKLNAGWLLLISNHKIHQTFWTNPTMAPFSYGSQAFGPARAKI